MTPTIKALAAVGTLGTLGGAGYATYYFSTDNSIAKVLKEKGHTLLSYDTAKDESTIWTPIVKAYASSQTKFAGVNISIKGGTDTNPTKEDINALKNACEKFITISKDDVANLKIAEQFCVKPITIKELIKKHRTVLNSETTTTIDGTTDNLWNNKVRDYLAAPTNKHIANVSLTSTAPKQEKEKRDALKKGCDDIGKN